VDGMCAYVPQVSALALNGGIRLILFRLLG
jgi:hypothetical protein